MSEETAKQAAILKLMRGFPSSQSSISEGTIAAYMEALEKYPVEAIGQAVNRYLSGDVPGQNRAFLPTAAELASQAGLFHRIAGIEARKAAQEQLTSYPMGELPPPGMEALGPLEVDFGKGMIDLRGMTLAEKEIVLSSKGETLPERPGKVPLVRFQRMTE